MLLVQAREDIADLCRGCIEELAAGRSDFTTGPVKEAQDRMLAGLDMSQEQMKKRVTKEALDVWLRACDNLSTYDRPISHLANGSDTHHRAAPVKLDVGRSGGTARSPIQELSL